MNRSIIRLFGVVILLFTVLIVWTSRWTVFDATALQNNSLNRLEFFATEKIKRGRILADNGAVLAESVRAGGGTWTRRYPYGPLFSQAVGYNVLSEAQRDRARMVARLGIAGQTDRLDERVRLLQRRHPRSVTTCTRRSTRRRRGWRGSWCCTPSRLHGHRGSVVAIVPQTGAVKVMYSAPSYNDNEPSSCKFPAAAWSTMPPRAELPPGSTFKLVTTTAALDSGKYTPDSVDQR